MYNRAIRAGKVTSDLVRGVPLLKENDIRVRYLTGEEEAELPEALPEDLQLLIAVGIQTGTRQGRVFCGS